MADENGDVKQAGLEDSNMANYGSKEHKSARKAAAASDKEFVGAGQKVGLEVWRVENRRTKSDTPDFGVKRWPKEDYGSFYSGDSYLVLNTYKVKVEGKETDKLAWDVHFWLGKDSSQDEIGVAAYKAVELDDLLDDGPVQHREVQTSESALFQSYFKGIQYMEGGIASGFRAVKPEEYKSRLFQVRRTRKAVRAFEVPVKCSSLNNGDVFILDAGLSVFMFIGEHANAFEKMKGGALASNIVSARKGKAKFFPEVNEDFWKLLGGGSLKDVAPAKDDSEVDNSDKPMEADKVKLFRLSDASGKLTFTKEREGKITEDHLDGNDAFIVDCEIEIFVWVGKGASDSEKSYCMKYAMDYLASQKKPATIPVTRIMQGQVHHVFGGVVAPKANSALPKSTRSFGGPSPSASTTGGTKPPAFANPTLRPASTSFNKPPVSAAPAQQAPPTLRPVSSSFSKPAPQASASAPVNAAPGLRPVSSSFSKPPTTAAASTTTGASANTTTAAGGSTAYNVGGLKSSGKKLW